MEKDKFKMILDSHIKWLKSEAGERPDLSGADLSGANLRGINLADANLNRVVGKNFYTVDGVGRFKSKSTYDIDRDIVFYGCWQGNLEEYKSKIEEVHHGNEEKWKKEHYSALTLFQTSTEEEITCE